MIHAVLVDDSEEDLKHADRLSGEELECVGIAPPDSVSDLADDLANRNRSGRCDIALLDYRLDAETPVDAANRRSYRGGTAAAALRETAPDVPIVLVTTEAKLRGNLSTKPKVEALFDHVVVKTRIANRHERPRVVAELVGLAEGFQAISSTPGSGWARVANAAGLEEETGLVALGEAQPPSGTSAIASWLLTEALRFPGPLLDRPAAAALIGVSLKSFEQPMLQSAIAAGIYTGAFSSFHERWWRQSLVRWLSHAQQTHEGEEELDRRSVIAAALGLTKNEIRPARCVWCGSADAVRSCSLCKRAVDPQHCVPVAIDDRPKWTEDAYACFSCIQRGDDAKAVHGISSRGIVEAIRTGSLTPSSQDDG